MSATTTRPYTVRDKTTPDSKPRLVRASNPAQALRYVTRDRFAVEPASANDVLDLVAAGITPETAGAETAAADEGGAA